MSDHISADDRTPEARPPPGSGETLPRKKRGRVAYAFEIVAVRLRFIGLLVAVVLLVGYWDSIKARVERWAGTGGGVSTASASDVEFYCPMHPNIVRDAMGNCPICGMPLSERKKGAKAETPEGVLARVQLSPVRIQQAGLRTSIVDWRPLEREVTTVGFVEWDERRLARITARFAGRIESLAVDFTGVSVERGKPLATIYAPEVYAAQEAFLEAARSLRRAIDAEAPDEASVARAQSLADAARSRLLLWGLWAEQIELLEREGKARPVVEVLAPLSGVVTRKGVVVGDYVAEGAALLDVADPTQVWIKARVYEDDLGLVATGAKVQATTSAYPGETFEGVVAFIDPFLDRATRTADLRVDVPNPTGRLKPGMYAAARVRIPLAEVEPFRSIPKPPPGPSRTVNVCDMHTPPIVRDKPGQCELCGGMELQKREVPGGPGANDVLAVPETAVIDTGRRKVVYVESTPGVFDAREVVLGPRAGTFYPVISGVEAGWKVATAGAFLVDAETRLNPAAAGTYFGASGTPETPK